MITLKRNDGETVLALAENLFNTVKKEVHVEDRDEERQGDKFKTSDGYLCGGYRRGSMGETQGDKDLHASTDAAATALFLFLGSRMDELETNEPGMNEQAKIFQAQVFLLNIFAERSIEEQKSLIFVLDLLARKYNGDIA